MTIVGIHQPNFMPWVGYFYKIYKCDIFVYLDNVQYVKGGYQNRVKILTSNNTQWLTVPVITKGKLFQPTNEVEISYKQKWVKKCLGTLEANYKKAKYFEKYYYGISNIFNKEHKYLSELSIDIIEYVKNDLNIKDTKMVLASNININPESMSTERIIDLCNALDTTTYFSGKGAKNYQNEQTFKENNINLVYTDFKFFEYPQLWTTTFEPGLSVIDYLFNCGNASFIENITYNTPIKN